MTDKVLEFSDPKAIEDQAREWLLRLDGDTALTTQELAALRKWTGQSPAHRQELLRIARFWSDANVLAHLSVPLPKPRVKGLSALVDARRFALVGTVFLLAVALSLGSWLFHERVTGTNGLYATAVGEQQIRTLADGSIIQLNTGSQVRVDYDRNYRAVYLLRGEAHFTVAHDPAYPFEVYVGVDVIRAVGTAFSVYLKGDEVRVTVSEGRVALASIEHDAPVSNSSPSARTEAGAASRNSSAQFLGSLNSGQSATLNRAVTEVRNLDKTSLERETAWREGLLVFAGAPLSEVIEQVSRYTPINIEIADAKLRSLPVGGRFKVDDLPAVLDVLESSFNIRVVRPDPQHIVLLARRQ